MTRWEHKVIMDCKEDELKRYGFAGWELVTVVWHPANVPNGDMHMIYYFKRQIVGDANDLS